MESGTNSAAGNVRAGFMPAHGMPILMIFIPDMSITPKQDCPSTP
jgi:hypothetical protein